MDMVRTQEEMVKAIGAMPERLGAAACFGEAIERDGHTLIPVARVSFGYGLGYGGGSGPKRSTNGNVTAEVAEGGGGGGGGGGSSTPVAVIDISRDDVVVKPVIDSTRISTLSMVVGGWVAFWLLLTVRTAVRERAKVRRHAIDKGAAA